MKFELSEFGERIGSRCGIEDLMQDLGEALSSGDDVKMLGGGQPARIPELSRVWHEQMTNILNEPGKLDAVLGNYEPPRGSGRFIESLATLLRERLGWPVGPENIAITAGGQTAFFFLFNCLAGKFSDGRKKEILLPFVPEYIGYSNQSTAGPMFRAGKPKIELIGEHEFKYRVDFDSLEITENTAALCVSRPTNPTGNVLTDREINHLADLAKQHGIPLIIDGAYGVPFPAVFFTDAKPIWNEDTVVTMSLSKIGLPGTRTGIVVAHPEIAAAVSSATATVGLANPNIGQALIEPLVRSGEILDLSENVVKPFYFERSKFAQKCLHEAMDPSLPYRVHVSEGALFLWLWFEGLPITTKELYQRLKAREVLIAPGEYFFFGLPEGEDWRHRDECLRMTFTMDKEIVKAGIQAIAEEVKRAYVEQV